MKPQFLRGVRGGGEPRLTSHESLRVKTPQASLAQSAKHSLLSVARALVQLVQVSWALVRCCWETTGPQNEEKLPLCGDFSLVFCRFVDISDVRCERNKKARKKYV